MPCGSGRFDTLHGATSGDYQDCMSRGANHRGSYPNLSTLVITSFWTACQEVQPCMRTPLLHIPTRYSCTSKPSCIHKPQTHSFLAASGLASSELEVKESFRDSTKRPDLHPSHSLHHPPRTPIVGVVGLNPIAPLPSSSHRCDTICQAFV
jgi:hypothetical protein